MIAAALVFFLFLSSRAAGAEAMVLLPRGTYRSFVLKSVAKKGEAPVFRSDPTEVESFFMDRRVVTNEEFRGFVNGHPQWRKSKIPSLFADEHYLSLWKSDLDFGGSKNRNKPVTGVSWFAARAYCASLKKSLPTTDQWEYALNDKGRNSSRAKEKILAWYGRPNSSAAPADAGADAPNGFGLHDMIGLVWEWTLDFNSFVTGDELSGKDDAFFCGGASLGKLSADDYAAFMRYSFRASLKAKYTTQNLGFRCVREKK